VHGRTCARRRSCELRSSRSGSGLAVYARSSLYEDKGCSRHRTRILAELWLSRNSCLLRAVALLGESALAPSCSSTRMPAARGLLFDQRRVSRCCCSPTRQHPSRAAEQRQHLVRPVVLDSARRSARPLLHTGAPRAPMTEVLAAQLVEAQLGRTQAAQLSENGELPRAL